MKRTFLILVLTGVVCAGCSVFKIESEEITTNYYPPKAYPEAVEYKESVDNPHEVIGFVTVNAERNQQISEVILKMKREAAILGGDAITNVTSNASGTWKKIKPQDLLGNAYVRANFTATVIAYK